MGEGGGHSLRSWAGAGVLRNSVGLKNVWEQPRKYLLWLLFLCPRWSRRRRRALFYGLLPIADPPPSLSGKVPPTRGSTCGDDRRLEVTHGAGPYMLDGLSW